MIRSFLQKSFSTPEETMPEDIIEMLWKCATCHHVNLGSRKTCEGCGKPKEDEEDFFPEDISHDAAVTDAEQLRAANAGEDWRCPYCRSSQGRLNGRCRNCGADQDGNVLRPEIPSSPVQSSPQFSEPEPRFESKSSFGGRFPILVAGLVLVAATVGGYFLFRTKIVEATVSDVSWKYSVRVERFQSVSHDGWSPDSGAEDVRELGKRFHHNDKVLDHYNTVHYTERVACGRDCEKIPRVCTKVPRKCSRIPEKCRTTQRSCTKLGNGYARCTGGDRVCSGGGESCTGGGESCTGGGESCHTRYCDERRTRQDPVYRDVPVYRTWYTWNLWEWVHNRDVPTSGTTNEPYWPSADALHLGIGLAPRQQERESRTEQYQVALSAEGERYPYSPKTLEEFRRFSVGSRCKIRVGVAHGVEILRE